eukprot:Hpha_TRINITY_DN1127_c0_g1::TRINITY_DN1127_c0_g1_i1::g.113168::m.113168
MEYNGGSMRSRSADSFTYGVSDGLSTYTHGFSHAAYGVTPYCLRSPYCLPPLSDGILLGSHCPSLQPSHAPSEHPTTSTLGPSVSPILSLFARSVAAGSGAVRPGTRNPARSSSAATSSIAPAA